MQSLTDFRSKYPQYNDLSDEQLTSSLHKKYYSDMPLDEFNQRLGLQKEQGFLNKLPRNIAAGLLEMGRGLANFPHNVAQLAGYGEKVAPLADESFDYRQFLGLPKEQTLADKLVSGTAEFLPAFGLPAAELGLAGEAIGSIPRVGRFAAQAMEQAVPQAAFGATQNKNPLMGAVEGGVGSLAGSVVGSGLEQLVNRLRPSKFLRGELSPEQLMKNLSVTKGTETSLGDVVESPTLKRFYENVLPHIIGSGTYKKMAKNASQIQESGNKLINEFSGDFKPENYGESIKDALTNSFKDVEQLKNKKFNKVDELARMSNVGTVRSNLKDEATRLLDSINQDPTLSHFMSNEDVNLLNQLIGKESSSEKSVIDYATGKNILKAPKEYDLKNTNILRSKIGEKAYEASYKGEQNKASIYNRLKNAIDKDIEGAIEQSPNNELKNAYKDAMDYYKNEYALYKDSDIQKFLKKGGDPDLILNHFIKGGKNDRAILLQKISKAVRQQPHGTDNILASSYLSRAMDNEGNLDPVKLSTLYHNLGKNQRNALFGTGNMHSKIKDYVDLVGKNKESFNLMFNPKTGQRNLDLLAKMGQMAGSLAHGGGALGFALPLAGLGISGKALTKLLTNPKTRESLVKSMIEGKEIQMPMIKKLLQKGSSFTADITGNDYEHKPMELLLTKKVK